MSRINVWVGRAATVTGWLVAVSFIASGLLALTGNPDAVGIFARSGHPDWVRRLAGAVELVGGLVLLVPRYTPLGAGVFAVAFVGGALTHWASGDAAYAAVPFVMLIPAGIVGLALWRHGEETLRWRARLDAFADRELVAQARKPLPW